MQQPGPDAVVWAEGMAVGCCLDGISSRALFVVCLHAGGGVSEYYWVWQSQARLKGWLVYK